MIDADDEGDDNARQRILSANSQGGFDRRVYFPVDQFNRSVRIADSFVQERNGLSQTIDCYCQSVFDRRVGGGGEFGRRFFMGQSANVDRAD